MIVESTRRGRDLSFSIIFARDRLAALGPRRSQFLHLVSAEDTSG